MVEQRNPFPNKEQLLQLKTELLARWQMLPAAHRASMALVLLQDVLAGDYGPWLQDALLLQQGRIQEALPATLLEKENGPTNTDQALFNPKVLENLPLPYTPEGEKHDALAQVKLVVPGDSRVWYVSAFDRQDLCFGLIVETEINYDYFNLSTLQTLQSADGQGVQRDPDFVPQPLDEVQARYDQRQFREGL